MRRWLWWLMPPWRAETRRRQVIQIANDWQDEEREAAAARRLAAEAARW
jgi:hypothetical protein